MHQNLKVGDKVLTLPGKRYYNLYVGSVGIITTENTYDGTPYEYGVRFLDNNSVFCAEHLKKVPKCKEMTTRKCND